MEEIGAAPEEQVARVTVRADAGFLRPAIEFVGRMTSLLGLVGGLLLAGRAATPLADLVAERFGRPPIADELAYLAIVVLVMVPLVTGVFAQAALAAHSDRARPRWNTVTGPSSLTTTATASGWSKV